MDRIIETELNAEFLSEARARGYKPYINSFKARDNETTPNFYLGSVQLRIRDDQGTRYFVGIDMFDTRSFDKRPVAGFAAQVECQFHVLDEHKKTANVSLSFDGFEAAEEFLRDIWRKMKFGYYERDQ